MPIGKLYTSTIDIRRRFHSVFGEKKLKRPPDDDLRLIIHVEQFGKVNYHFLWVYLNHRKPPCPYSQVFIFGQNGDNPRKWFGAQIYPGDLAELHELDEDTAKNLILDRIPYSKIKSAEQGAAANP